MRNLFAKFCFLLLLFCNLLVVPPSCGTAVTTFKFSNTVVYMPLNKVEDFNNYIEYDRSVLLPRDIEWSSSDPDTVEIVQSGLAKSKRSTARNEMVTITAKAAGNIDTVYVIVGDFYFNTDVIVLEEGGEQVRASDYIISSSGSVNTFIKYSVQDPTVATVVESGIEEGGLITPLKEGVTKLYAETDGGTAITCVIAVNSPMVSSFVITLNTDGESYTLSSYTGGTNYETVTLPKYKDGFPITTAHEVFLDNKKINEIYVPDTYTTFTGSYFVKGCSVNKLVIPESVVNIEENIFVDCSNLSSGDKINKVSGMMFFPNEKNSYAFLVGIEATSINTSIEIPYRCVAVTNHAFDGSVIGSATVNKLNSIKFISDEGVSFLRCISTDAFSNNVKIKSVNLPEGLIYIHKAFRNLTLEDVHLPSTLRYVNGDWLENSIINNGPDAGVVKSVEEINSDDNICFYADDIGMYLGSTKNPYLYLYRIIGNNRSSTIRIHKNCKIIGPNAFVPWGDTFSGELTSFIKTINPINNTEADKYNRLYTIDASETDLSEVAIACITKGAFNKCIYITNLILSVFVEYFDATDIESIGSNLTYIFCERTKITNYYTPINGASPKYLFYSASPIYDQQHWYYEDRKIVPTIWFEGNLA